MVEQYHGTIAKARKELVGYLRKKLSELIATGPYDGRFCLGTVRGKDYWYINDGVYEVGADYRTREPRPWHRRINDPDKISFNKLPEVNGEGEDELIKAVYAVEAALRK